MAARQRGQKCQGHRLHEVHIIPGYVHLSGADLAARPSLKSAAILPLLAAGGDPFRPPRAICPHGTGAVDAGRQSTQRHHPRVPATGRFLAAQYPPST